MSKRPDILTGLSRRWKAKLGWVLGLALPVLSAFLAENWVLILWGLLPVLFLELAPWPSWRFLRSEGYKQPEMTTGWLVGAAVFLVVFVASTVWPALNCQHKLPGYDMFAHRDWLGLGRLDDVTYRAARPAEVSNQLVVVTMPAGRSGQLVEEYRSNLLSLIHMAYENNAVGVGLDYFFDESTEEDEGLGETAKDYYDESKGYFRVFLGYRFVETSGRALLPKTPALSLIDETMSRKVDPETPGYFGSNNHGHTLVFSENRGGPWSRSVPLGFSGREAEPALCVRMAEHVLRVGGRLTEGKLPESRVPLREAVPVDRPRGDLLHFVPPEKSLLHLRYEEVNALQDAGSLEPLFRRRFVLVGTHDGADFLRTPWFDEPIPGVFLQAYATEALLQQHWVVRAEWWYALLGVILPVLSMATRFSRGRSLVGMLKSNVALSLFVFGLSGVIIHLSNVWIDVSYVIVGVWVFFALGVAAQQVLRLTRRRRTLAPAGEPPTD